LEVSLEVVWGTWLRKLHLISRALKICAGAKNAEELPVRTGRCCLFSVICVYSNNWQPPIRFARTAQREKENEGGGAGVVVRPWRWKDIGSG
jgi:hypothetical protein